MGANQEETWDTSLLQKASGAPYTTELLFINSACHGHDTGSETKSKKPKDWHSSQRSLGTAKDLWVQYS